MEKVKVEKDFLLKVLKKQEEFEKETKVALRIIDDDLGVIETKVDAYIAGKNSVA